VNRGGCWGGIAAYCRVADRDGVTPSYRGSGIGFRLALSNVRTDFAPYVVISKESLTLEVGATATLTATVVTPDGTSNSVTWTSSNERVATVNSYGMVTGISNGTATIYARTVDGLTGSCVVTVEGDRTYTVNGVSFKMVKVDGGTFQMGSTDGDSSEQPVHSVTLLSFSIGETEVTQALWYAVMGSNPSSFTGNTLYPVEYVSWNDCQEFITKLNQLTGQTFRLPTEAEWEFAARGGNSSQGYTYSGSNTIGDVAWYTSNSSSKTHPVATKQANELGLYDMSGNVWEWCQDWYSSSYYSSSPSNNPTGPSSGSSRVLRGGCWGHFATRCRVADRKDLSPTGQSYFIGFRLAQ
jgi:formylglycine-generating enzyme required for sulfatase activity